MPRLPSITALFVTGTLAAANALADPKPINYQGLLKFQCNLKINNLLRILNGEPGREPGTERINFLPAGGLNRKSGGTGLFTAPGKRGAQSGFFVFGTDRSTGQEVPLWVPTISADELLKLDANLNGRKSINVVQTFHPPDANERTLSLHYSYEYDQKKHVYQPSTQSWCNNSSEDFDKGQVTLTESRDPGKKVLEIKDDSSETAFADAAKTNLDALMSLLERTPRKNIKDPWAQVTDAIEDCARASDKLAGPAKEAMKRLTAYLKKNKTPAAGNETAPVTTPARQSDGK